MLRRQRPSDPSSPSVPENIWEMKLPEMVLLIACIIMASNTLCPVLFISQAKTTGSAVT